MQEDADTRKFLHAAHAVEDGLKSLIIVFNDTDVLVLCLSSRDLVPYHLKIVGNLYQVSELITMIEQNWCQDDVLI